jgi:MFS family permease
VALLFLLMGTTVGSWLSRAPDVKAQVGLDDGAWGTVLVSSTVGSLVALGLLGRLMGRVGPRVLVLVAAPALLLVAPVMASAGQAPVLAAGLVAFGLSTGILNTPMNTLAVAVERTWSRPIMSSFHACFSLGTLLGALLGSAGAAAGLPPAVQLGLSGAVLGALLLALARDLPAGPAAGPSSERATRRLTPVLLVLAAMGLASLLAEGTAGAWSAIYVSQTLGAGGTAGAVAYACFAGAMTTGRLGGDRVVHVLGRRRFLQVSGLVAGGTPAAAFVGFGLLGLGLSCVTPTIFGLAGNQPGVGSGAGILVVTIASWPAFLVGPPLVGAVSSQTSLRVALLLLPVAAVLLSLLATRLPRPR